MGNDHSPEGAESIAEGGAGNGTEMANQKGDMRISDTESPTSQRQFIYGSVEEEIRTSPGETPKVAVPYEPTPAKIGHGGVEVMGVPPSKYRMVSKLRRRVSEIGGFQAIQVVRNRRRSGLPILISYRN